MICEARRSKSFLPGTASKLFGCMNFIDSGAYGKVAKVGLAAIKARQYERGAKQLTDEIRSSFTIVEAFLATKPVRIVKYGTGCLPVLLLASDAAPEGGRGAGGLLFVLKKSCWALVAGNLPAAASAFGRSTYIIAQLEMLMVLLAILAEPRSFRGCRTTWFIDNIPALWALVKGSAGCPILNTMSYMVHLILFGLRGHMFFEYIESKANWADELSRVGFASKFARAEGFSVRRACVWEGWWRLPPTAWPRVADFL